MSTLVRFELHHADCPLRVPPQGSLALLASNRLGDTYAATAPTAQALDHWTATLPGLAPATTILHRTPTSLIYRTTDRGCPVPGLVADTGGTLLGPVVHRGGSATYRAALPSPSRWDALRRRLGELGTPTLAAPVEVSEAALPLLFPLAEVSAFLTERQLEVLWMAVQAGYYDSPRRVRTIDLAPGLGISRPTFEEHLRKAESRILRAFVRLLPEGAPLSILPTRRPGRPRTPGDAPTPPPPGRIGPGATAASSARDPESANGHGPRAVMR